MSEFPGGTVSRERKPTPSVIFPLLSNWREVWRKGYVVPALVTMYFAANVTSKVLSKAPVEELFAAMGEYAILCIYYFTYRFCGKRGSWRVHIGYLAAAFAYHIAAIPIVQALEQPFAVRGVGSLGAGLVEEVSKAVPVVSMLLVGRVISRRGWRIANGPWLNEPLDGILLGVGSGVVFAFVEALVYAPKEGAATIFSRTFSAPMLHASTTGLLGYFIGLAVFMPRSAVPLIGIGYGIAAGSHTLWDALVGGPLAIADLLVAAVNYLALAAAILKARKISPTRDTNFASWVIVPDSHDSVKRRDPQPEIQTPVSSRPQAFNEALNNRALLLLKVADRIIPLGDGTKLVASELTGHRSTGTDPVVAVVERRDSGSAVIGLANVSTTAWVATTARGERRVEPNQVIKLQAGTSINFGSVTGRVDE
jgi:RsiW-degrading membrane proteinase PrsW (M82 family)